MTESFYDDAGAAVPFSDELSLVGKWPSIIPEEDDDDPDDDEAVPDVTSDFCVLSVEQIEDQRRHMFGGGVYGFWDVRQTIAQRLHDTASRLSEKYIAREEQALGEDEALRRLQAREQEVESLRELVNDQVPPWQQISGISTKGEHFENPNRRAAGLRKLLSGVERLLRFELNNVLDSIGNAGVESSGKWLDRSFQWDPLRAICLQYQIAQRRLSGFSKELTGLSAIELVDGIRAEKVRAALKAELKRFMVSRENHERLSKGHAEDDGGKNNVTDRAEQIFAALKSSRRGPRFHRANWAVGFGFSSYQKFFRACLHCYGLTPHQLEIALIDEILLESEKNGDGNRGHEDHEGRLKEHGGKQKGSGGVAEKLCAEDPLRRE